MPCWTFVSAASSTNARSAMPRLCRAVSSSFGSASWCQIEKFLWSYTMKGESALNWRLRHWQMLAIPMAEHGQAKTGDDGDRQLRGPYAQHYRNRGAPPPRHN